MKTLNKPLIFLVSALAFLSLSGCDEAPEEPQNKLSNKEKYLNKKLQSQKEALEQDLNKASSDMKLTVVNFKQDGKTRDLTNDEKLFFAELVPQLCSGKNNLEAIKKELFKKGFGNIKFTGTMHDQGGNSKDIDLSTQNSENSSFSCKTALSSIGGT